MRLLASSRVMFEIKKNNLKKNRLSNSNLFKHEVCIERMAGYFIFISKNVVPFHNKYSSNIPINTHVS